MKILVLMKQTFDTEEKIVMDNGSIKEDGVNFIINPYDEYAIEEAVRLKEQLGAEITVITVGPARSEVAIRTAFAMGVDHAIHIEYEGEADEYVISKLITATIKQREFNFIIGGNLAIDSGAGQVAIRVAELLGIPHISSITKLSIEGEKATVERDVEGDVEIIEVHLPFLATAQQGLNEPRYPSLPGIMKAKKKPIERILIDDPSLSSEDMKVKAVVTAQYLPLKKEAGRVLSGDNHSKAKELVQLLHHEAKVI